MGRVGEKPRNHAVRVLSPFVFIYWKANSRIKRKEVAGDLSIGESARMADLQDHDETFCGDWS